MSDKTSDKRYRITLTGRQLALVGDAVELMVQAMVKVVDRLESYMSAWVPAARELPNDLQEVNVLFVNHNPPSYYANMKDIQQTGCAVFYDGKWFWYTPTARDFLAEYQRCPDLEMDKNIEVIAWAPIPEPPKGEDSK